MFKTLDLEKSTRKIRQGYLMKMRKQRDRNIIQFFKDLRKFTKIYNTVDEIQYDIQYNFFLLFTSEHFFKGRFHNKHCLFSIDPLEYLCCPVSLCSKSLVLIV